MSIGEEKGGPWAVLVFDTCFDEETGQEWEEFALLIGPFPTYNHAVAHPTKLTDSQKRAYVAQRHPDDHLFRKRVKRHVFERDYDSPICRACGLHRDEKVHEAA